MEKEKIFLEEQEKLNEVIKFINEKIDKFQQKFDEQQHFIIGFKEGQRGTQFTRQALMSFYATEVSDLKYLEKNPYFGKMNFKKYGDNDVSPIYIGKRQLTDDNQNIISYDWRSPIASMYYDYSLGEAEYKTNEGTVKGEILSKRQIQIENGKLLSVDEQDTLTDDSILLKYLNENADSRLKSIVATIQKEQNKIIRSPLKNNYIVQGVAGSGKTTVALHRIAYLLYTEAKNINESEFMILGPNKYFLNYISELLPDLDIRMVSQATFEELALKNIKSRAKLESQNETLQNILSNKEDQEIIKYKSSLEFLKLIEDFVEAYLKSHLSKPIMYEGLQLYSGDNLIELMDFNSVRKINKNYGSKIDNISKFLIKFIKEKSDVLSRKIWLRYKEEYKSLEKDNPRRKEILNIVNATSDEIKKGCPKTIKEAFKFAKIDPLNLYIAFIDSLEQSLIRNNIDCQKLKEQTLEKLNKKKIGYDDLAPLLLIKYLLSGLNEYNTYQHLVIDEGQDLSISQYSILKLLFPKATFDIYGDLNQSIYSYQGVNNWEELNKEIFNSNGNLLELNKGYRTTEQISETSNYVLEELNANLSECIARTGEDIILKETDNNINGLLSQIEKFINKEYKTIAIICKDNVETDKLHRKLTNLGLNIHKISEKDLTYSGGLCIMPAYLSKGLEFDAVIISDANENVYNADSTIDMKLLYVAITRALHELHINYTGELTKPLNNMLKEKEIQKVKKLHD